MFSKFTSSYARFSAIQAYIWGHTRVFPGVSDERAGHSECHAAGVADVGFLPRVSALVVHQSAGLCEALPTFSTLIRLLTAVLPYVNFQIARSGESCSTEITFMRLFFSVMHAAMIDQLTFLSKTCLTRRTIEGLLSCVYAHVGLQLVALSEGAGTELALIGFEALVYAHVSAQAAHF